MSTPLQHVLQSLLGSTFEIRRELLGGGMSRVFVAYEPALKREVVIKVLPPDLLSATSLARFRQEIEVTARLQHPHILPVVTTGGTDSLIYFVVPYVAGGSLRERLQSGERPTLEQGVRLTEELLAAIAVAHERGVVHRDIKPGNVLLSEGHAILADFGIARALHGDESPGDAEPLSISVAAPDAYRAPERPRDSAADLYAIAVLAYEMMTGSLPDNVSESAIAAALLDANRGASPELLRSVARVLARALARDPSRRFTTAREFRAALAANARSRRDVTAPRTVAAAVLILTVGSGLWFTSRQYARGDELSQAGEVAGAAAQADSSFMDSSVVLSALAADTLERPGAATLEPGAATTALPVDPFDMAMGALDRHDATESRRLLGSVSAPSPNYARAQLQLALLDAWAPSPRGHESATRAAARALGGSSSREELDPRELALAQGLVALGNHDFVTACDSFERARASRSDFHAWMGLGECRTRDTVVVERDGALTFRGSYFEAARAYVEASRRAPAALASQALGRLSEVAFVERARVRRGWVDNQRVILGTPRAVADSFTFALFEPGQPRRVTPDAALAQNRALAMGADMLRPALVAHTRAVPTDVRSRLMLVELLELEGNVEAPRSEGITALEEIAAARRLDLDRSTALRFANVHVRLLLRAEAYDAAGRLADSLITGAPPDLEAIDAGQLLPLALLTGRVATATRLSERIAAGAGRQVRMRDGGALRLSAATLQARAAFTVRAALGVCDADVRAAPRALLDMLSSQFPTGAVPRGAANAFIEREVLHALPCIGREQAGLLHDIAHPLGRALLAGTDEERAQLSERLSQLRATRASNSLFLETPENALLDAQVYLASADSTGARETLSRMIRAIPLLPPPLLGSEFGIGPMVRGMALRAELAAAAGDHATARELSGAVAALWQHADPVLQPVVARMRELVGEAIP